MKRPASVTASGGATYIWNTVETTAAFNVSPIATTTYTVTAITTNGCTDTDQVTISVTSLFLNLTEDTTICLDEMITLSARNTSLL